MDRQLGTVDVPVVPLSVRGFRHRGHELPQCRSWTAHGQQEVLQEARILYLAEFREGVHAEGDFLRPLERADGLQGDVTPVQHELHEGVPLTCRCLLQDTRGQ